MKNICKMTSLLIIAAFITFSISISRPCFAQEPSDKDPNIKKPAEPNIDDEQVDEVLDELKKSDPPKFERLRQLRREEPEKFRHELRDFVSRRSEGGRAERPDRPMGPQTLEGEPPDARFFHQQQTEFIAWLQKNYSQQAEEVNQLKQKDSRLYARSLHLSWQKYRHIYEASQTNPELANILKDDLELVTERDNILRKLNKTTDEKGKAELIKNLETVVSKRFDIIVKKKQIGYEQLQARIKKLEEEVKEGQAKIEKWKDPEFKNKTVKSHLDELLRNTDKFKWD